MGDFGLDFSPFLACFGEFWPGFEPYWPVSGSFDLDLGPFWPVSGRFCLDLGPFLPEFGLFFSCLLGSSLAFLGSGARSKPILAHFWGVGSKAGF